MFFPFLQAEAADKLQNTLASADSTKAVISNIHETITTSSAQDIVSSLAQEAINFGLKVLAALAIYIIGGWIIRRIKKMLKRGFERKGTDATIATFTVSVVTIALWVIVIILTVGSLGVNTSSLAALLAAGGMAIGMALGGTVQNFAGGIMILAFKPFKAGDYIEALGFAGIVQEVSMVFRGYYCDDTATKAAIREVIASNPKILDAKTEGAADPFVAVIELSQSSVNYVIRVWTRAENYWEVFFFLNETLYTELPKKGVTFPFQQLDVHIKQS